MNNLLEKMIHSGDIVSHKSLLFSVGHTKVAYVSEYKMKTKLGPYKWYSTWLASNDVDASLSRHASIIEYKARAKSYFPAFLDCRIPPENREGIEDYLSKLGLTEYDKFNIIIATGAEAYAKAGTVELVESVHCCYDDIWCIDLVYKEYMDELR